MILGGQSAKENSGLNHEPELLRQPVLLPALLIVVLVSLDWLFFFKWDFDFKCFVYSACSCSLLWAPPPPAPGVFLNSQTIILFFHPILLRWLQKYEAIFIFEWYIILTLNIHVLITQSLSWKGVFINIIQIVLWLFLYPRSDHVKLY